MAGGPKWQNKSTSAGTNKKLKNDIRQAVLDKICKELYESSQRNSNKKPYGSVAKIVKDMKTDFPWMNRDVVNYAFKKYQNEKRKTSGSEDIDNNLVAAPTQKKGSRPVGTTMVNKLKKEVATRLCLDQIAIEYHSMRKDARADGRKAERGTFTSIVKRAKEKYGLGDDVVIHESTIRGREHRNSLIVKSMGPESPMADVEPVLVDLIIKMSTIRRCLTPSQCLHLANDLIAGTETEQKVIKFKENISKKNMRRLTLD